MSAEPSAPPRPAGARPPELVQSRRWYWALLAISLAGGLDVAQFLATNRSMFSAAPDRAAGSVLGLLLWLMLAAVAGRGTTALSSPRLARGTVAVAGIVAAGSLGLAAVHAAAHVGGLRPALGAILGVAALGIAFAAVRS